MLLLTAAAFRWVITLAWDRAALYHQLYDDQRDLVEQRKGYDIAPRAAAMGHGVTITVGRQGWRSDDAAVGSE